MKRKTFEKLFPFATSDELWEGWKPVFRALDEVRRLKHYGIVARFERHDYKQLRVLVEPETKKQENFLRKRGYDIRTIKSRKRKKYSDVVQTILRRPRTGAGGGIPLTRGEVAMLFLDGYAGDGPGLLDIRSQGYGEDDDWDGLTAEDVFCEDEDTAFVWEKWEPLELWPD